MELVTLGADRQEMHERIREHSMIAWQAVERNEPNPLFDLLVADSRMEDYLPPQSTRQVLESGVSVGDAPDRCREFASIVRGALAATTAS